MNPWELPSPLGKRQADRQAPNIRVKYRVRGMYERSEGHSGITEWWTERNGGERRAHALQCGWSPELRTRREGKSYEFMIVVKLIHSGAMQTL